MVNLHSQNHKKGTEETQINGKISHVCRLEELKLLKCLYCPKGFTNSMQSLSKFGWHFSQK